MNVFTNLYRIALESVRVVPKTEDLAIRTTTYTFEKVSELLQEEIDVVDGEYVVIQERGYELPTSASDSAASPIRYHSIQEISSETNIPEATLWSWCKSNKLVSLQDTDGRWWIEGNLVDVQKINGRWHYRQIT